jgi:hypothetical protein
MTQKAGKKRIRNREQVAQALELRKAGASYQAIADTMGFKSKSRAHDLVTEGLKELEATCTGTAEELRRLELERVDAIILGLWPQRKSPRVADSILRAQARRAALLGLDAPQKIAPTLPTGEALPPPAPLTSLPTELLEQVVEHLKAAPKPEA